MEAVLEVFLGAKTEIIIFVVAVCTHAVLFGFYRVRPTGKKAPAESPEKAAKQIQSTTQALTKTAKQLLRLGASEAELVEALDRELDGLAPGAAREALVTMLETVSRFATAELVAAVRSVARGRALAGDAQLSELLLRNCMHLKLQAEFGEVLAEVEAAGSATPSIAVLGLRSALGRSDLEGATRHLRGCSALFRASSAGTASAAPHIIMQQLAHLAAEKAAMPALLRELDAMGLLTAGAGAVKAMFHECAQRGDSESMREAEALSGDRADVVTYNSLIKRHLQKGEFKQVRSIIEAMQAAGGSLAPNCVTFNELIDATIRTSVSDAWRLLDEMKGCGLQPSSITCSILLKSVQRDSRPADIDRALAFAMESTMDEVLLSSLCEACIRSGRHDLLRQQIQRHRAQDGVQVNGAHTFGSIIRAYGFLKDTEGAWAAWREMRGRRIVPTSITIGCMVEAQVMNGDPDSGYELIRELMADAEAKPLVNAVIYCSVIKGFSHQKRFEKVWVVYDEMLRERIQLSIVTYNALIDACARSCQMSRTGPLLEEMANQKIEPNLVTYSTIIKGYCQEGRLEKGFELLEAMKQSEQFKPDEIAYNTLIDGCAHRGMWDTGMKLLASMEDERVPPSTFTLSVLVKLANRSRKADKAFELCDRLAKKYRLSLNVHVYNNLVHACTASGETRKGLNVLEQMVRERVRPDARTYGLLLRSCLSMGDADTTDGLMRAACGLKGALPQLARHRGGARLDVQAGLPQDLVTAVVEGINSEQLAMDLFRDLKAQPGMKLDPRLSLSFTSKAIRPQRDW